MLQHCKLQLTYNMITDNLDELLDDEDILHLLNLITVTLL